jgi:anaerobic selenocysteine-containing dehydrogenase
VVWDKAGQKPAIWDVSEVAYKPLSAVPTLSGTFDIPMKDGFVVTCKTVWDTFCEEVNKYPLDKVEEITWIRAKDIDEYARLYARSKPASIQWGVPIDMTPAVTPLCQAIATLWAITGNLDVPGGNVISRYAFDAVAYALPGATGVIKLKNKEQDKLRIGADRYGPFNKFIWRTQTDLTLEQILSGQPYPIKGMWIQTCTPVGIEWIRRDG